jgi:hypothetical protein
MDIAAIRDTILHNLVIAAEHGHSAVREKLQFDADGLLVGSYLPNSLVGMLQLRTKGDIEHFFSLLADGTQFSASFAYEDTSHSATITTALLSHPHFKKTIENNNL